MSEMRTTRDLLEAIYAERGGVDNFTIIQQRISMALAHSLRDPQSIDAGLVARLVDQLPIITTPHCETHEDLSLLSDEELDRYEALVEKALGPGAALPDTTVVNLLRSVEHVQAVADEATRLRDIAQQSELMHARMAREAGAEVDRLRVELDRVHAQLGKIASASIAPSTTKISGNTELPLNSPSSNVVPLDKYGAIAAINSRW
jgi:hypothetical protein